MTHPIAVHIQDFAEWPVEREFIAEKLEAPFALDGWGLLLLPLVIASDLLELPQHFAAQFSVGR